MTTGSLRFAPKRLALACALYEKRDVLILDEVAAGFDPEFKSYFYTTLLKTLSREYGFTIIAITHDRDFFDAADRGVELVDGNLRET